MSLACWNVRTVRINVNGLESVVHGHAVPLGVCFQGYLPCRQILGEMCPSVLCWGWRVGSVLLLWALNHSKVTAAGVRDLFDVPAFALRRCLNLKPGWEMSQGSLRPGLHHEIHPDFAQVPLGEDRVHWRGKKQHIIEQCQYSLPVLLYSYRSRKGGGGRTL